MPPKKPQPEVVEKIVYQDRVVYKNPLTLENISLAKQWIYTVGPVILAAYLWVIPQIDARAAEYVKEQFIAVGMDPQTLQKLGVQLEALKGEVARGEEARKKIEGDVGQIKSDIGKVLTIIERQQPVYVAPPIQQVLPVPAPAPVTPTEIPQ